MSLLDEDFGAMARVGLWPVLEFLNQISSSLIEYQSRPSMFNSSTLPHCSKTDPPERLFRGRQ